MKESIVDRAQACFVGLIMGDSLGALTDGMQPGKASAMFQTLPEPHEVVKAGLIAGQPTAVAEAAMVTARTLSRTGKYDPVVSIRQYRLWAKTDPPCFEKGLSSAIAGIEDAAICTSSVFARCIPITMAGIRLLGRSGAKLKGTAEWVRADAILTHQELCADAAVVFACMLSEAMEHGVSGEKLCKVAIRAARDPDIAKEVGLAVKAGMETPPGPMTAAGPLRTLHTAAWHVSRKSSLEEVMLAIIANGEQACSDGAACGALFSAIGGMSSLPASWVAAVAACKPKKGAPSVRTPRPRVYWPGDVFGIVASLSWSPEFRVAMPERRDPGAVESDLSELEKQMRGTFDMLMKKIDSGCTESLEKIEEMAKVEHGVGPSHKYMFADFATRLRKKGLMQQALLHAERTVSLAPDDPHAHFNMARIYLRLGDREKAKSRLEDALLIWPEFYLAEDFMGWLAEDGEAW